MTGKERHFCKDFFFFPAKSNSALAEKAVQVLLQLVCPSVCQSHTRLLCQKDASHDHKIFTNIASGLCSYLHKIHPEIRKVHPQARVLNEIQVEKLAIFGFPLAVSVKWSKKGRRLLLISNRKSANMWPEILVSGNIRFMRTFARVTWRQDVKQAIFSAFSCYIFRTFRDNTAQ